MLRRVVRCVRTGQRRSLSSADDYVLPGQKPIVLADRARKDDKDAKPVYFIMEEETPINYDEVSLSKCNHFLVMSSLLMTLFSVE